MQRRTSSELIHPPSVQPILDAGAVELWTAWVDADEDLSAAAALLDDDERARADRFHFRRDRDRSIARRAFTRRVLAGYIGADPAAVAITTGEHGKPALDPGYGISFNCSHADGLAVVAVAYGREIGVDVERIREIDDAMDVAAGFLTDLELAVLRSTPAMSRSALFLTLWTRKESFVKAVGGGLSVPLDSFDCSVVGDAGVGRPRGAAGDLPYSFVGLDVPGGYIGAATVEGTRVAIRHMDAARLAA